MRLSIVVVFALVAGALGDRRGQAGDPVVWHIPVNGANEPVRHVSPLLYGLMTEEINYSYDGGLYAELVRNRNFNENTSVPVHWQLVEAPGGAGSMALDVSEPVNDAIARTLKLTVTQATSAARVGVANEGFWGIPVRPAARYRASVYAKASHGFTGTLTVAIVSHDGATVHASVEIPRVTAEWRTYDVTLTCRGTAASADNRLVISTGEVGTVWLGFVSVMPPTWNNRLNGTRADIMRLLADMKPAFLRFPGGNYLEGNTIATRFDWRKTIGDIARRAGHLNTAWGYWSSDGMGLLEFLEWCEDLHMQPVLAVYAGFSLRGERVAPGSDLAPYVTDALDEIDYVAGDSHTPWGSQRAKDGHPAPFRLEYVEVGNEDNFDRQAGSYDGRFAQFFDAIKAKDTRLQVIATARVTSRTPDVIDEHYYRGSEDEMASHAHDYDVRPRAGPKVFVGEWATRVGSPTPNMSAALGDAAWMTGMEQNSDLVIMSAYAPLFVNVNPGGMQWRTDLVGYDTLTSYGSPAYYAQQMFSAHHGDVVLAATAQGIPTREWRPAGRRASAAAANGAQPSTPPAPPPQQVPTLFFSATRDSTTGSITLKVVNRAGTAQPVRVEISGLATVDSTGTMIAMGASRPDDTNSITEPTRVVPVTARVSGLGAQFTRAFPPYSITILQMTGK
jgi:alpha-N-arabinofuranosidase